MLACLLASCLSSFQVYFHFLKLDKCYNGSCLFCFISHFNKPIAVITNRDYNETYQTQLHI